MGIELGPINTTEFISDQRNADEADEHFAKPMKICWGQAILALLWAKLRRLGSAQWFDPFDQCDLINDLPRAFGSPDRRAPEPPGNGCSNHPFERQLHSGTASCATYIRLATIRHRRES